MKSVHMYHDDTLKWRNGEAEYCLHVELDEYPQDPRSWDNISVLACFHRNYSLGDAIDEKNPEDHWRMLVRRFVSDEEVFRAARDGKLEGIRLERNPDCQDEYDVYETCYLYGWQSPNEAKECLEYSEIGERSVSEYINDDLTIGHCQTLLEPYLEWKPLWLYDHSGISISCGRRVWPYNDMWDSGQVGFAYVTRQKLVEEGIVSADSDDWRSKASEIIMQEVEDYDMFVRGDCHYANVYIKDDDCCGAPEADGWRLEESVGGFLGSDIVENGIADSFSGYGLLQAIEEDRFDTGTARRTTYTRLTF